MNITIKEAQTLHDSYGVVFECDADKRIVIAYDDEEDRNNGYPIGEIDHY